MEAPKLSPHDWIGIGTEGRIRAVIVQAYCDKHADYEVVYLDSRGRAICEDVKWEGQRWEFATESPVGGYADKYDRLRGFVSQLRRGTGA